MISCEQNLDLIAVFYDKEVDFFFLPVIWTEYHTVIDKIVVEGQPDRVEERLEFSCIVIWGGDPVPATAIDGFLGYDLLMDHPHDMIIDEEMWESIAIRKKIKKVKRARKPKTVEAPKVRSNVIQFKKRVKS